MTAQKPKEENSRKRGSDQVHQYCRTKWEEKRKLLDVAIKRPLLTMKRTAPVSLCSFVIGPDSKHR